MFNTVFKLILWKEIKRWINFIEQFMKKLRVMKGYLLKIIFYVESRRHEIKLTY